MAIFVVNYVHFVRLAIAGLPSLEVKGFGFNLKLFLFTSNTSRMF